MSPDILLPAQSGAYVGPSIIVPPGSVPINYGSFLALDGVNYAHANRFFVASPQRINTISSAIGVSSGNIELAIIRMSSRSAHSAKLATTGIVAAGATGARQWALTAVDLAIGDYAVVVWADNTTVTFAGRTFNYETTGQGYQTVSLNAGAGGIPASGAGWGATTRQMGLILENI